MHCDEQLVQGASGSARAAAPTPVSGTAPGAESGGNARAGVRPNALLAYSNFSLTLSSLHERVRSRAVLCRCTANNHLTGASVQSDLLVLVASVLLSLERIQILYTEMSVITLIL